MRDLISINVPCSEKFEEKAFFKWSVKMTFPKIPIVGGLRNKIERKTIWNTETGIIISR